MLLSGGGGGWMRGENWKECVDWMKNSRFQNQNTVEGVANVFERQQKQRGAREKVGSGFRRDLLSGTFGDWAWETM